MTHDQTMYSSKLNRSNHLLANSSTQFHSSLPNHLLTYGFSMSESTRPPRPDPAISKQCGISPGLHLQRTAGCRTTAKSGPEQGQSNGKLTGPRADLSTDIKSSRRGTLVLHPFAIGYPALVGGLAPNQFWRQSTCKGFLTGLTRPMSLWSTFGV